MHKITEMPKAQRNDIDIDIDGIAPDFFASAKAALPVTSTTPATEVEVVIGIPHKAETRF